MSMTPPGMTPPSEYHDYLLRWRKGVNDTAPQGKYSEAMCLKGIENAAWQQSNE